MRMGRGSIVKFKVFGRGFEYSLSFLLITMASGRRLDSPRSHCAGHMAALRLEKNK